MNHQPGSMDGIFDGLRYLFDNIHRVPAFVVPYDEVMLAAFIPLAYTQGTDFKSAKRVRRDEVLHWDRW